VAGYFLADPIRIDIGGIEEINTGVQRLPVKRERGILIKNPVPPFRSAITHAPETNARDL
jgi:hypothetical protein